jgi:hypothetical protein
MTSMSIASDSSSGKRLNKNQKKRFFNKMRWTGKNEKDMPCAFNMQAFILVQTFFRSLKRLRYGKFA